MAVQSITLFRIGDPFSGFGLRVKAGFLGINNKKIFKKLESEIDEIFQILENISYQDWEYKLREYERSKKFEDSANSDFRLFDFLISGDNSSGEKMMIIRSFSPFPLFESGGWMVHNGIRLDKNNNLIKMSDDELFKYW